MAGTNKVLKDGQILFKAGDKSDGMYLIRRGELRVYLEKDGKEVALAAVGEGGMIGEMALFDNLPRSASVKATKESEVTLISQEDFSKLMKQIPKWFVGLMSALSSRLRQTNERLKNIESTPTAGGTTAPPAEPVKALRPYQGVIRQLNVIALLFHRDGEKDGKEWILAKAPIEAALVDLFGESPEKLRDLLSVMVKAKVMSLRQDSYKNPVLAIANRASLTALLTFITQFPKANPEAPFLTDDVIAILIVFERILQASPYDASTVSLVDIIKEGKRDGKDTSTWDKAVNSLAKAGEEVKIVKASTGPGLKAQKKDIATFILHCQVLAALYQAKLL